MGKSIAMYALLIAISLGAGNICFVDSNPEKLAHAMKTGASEVFESTADIKAKYDIVVEASSTRKGLEIPNKTSDFKWSDYRYWFVYEKDKGFVFTNVF